MQIFLVKKINFSSSSSEENILNKSFTDLDLNSDTESRLGTVNFHYQESNGIVKTMNVEEYTNLSIVEKESLFDTMKLKKVQKEESKESKVTTQKSKISSSEKRQFFLNNPSGPGFTR
ncbi:MAG: hypothetical protein O3A66_01170 [Proteobacteria bacterium]|nr:hypothetical protein [Pseudomonadota bacterium]